MVQGSLSCVGGDGGWVLVVGVLRVECNYGVKGVLGVCVHRFDLISGVGFVHGGCSLKVLLTFSYTILGSSYIGYE